jgi:ABC-type multidrug transport system fused ATPase/permease subunit
VKHVLIGTALAALVPTLLGSNFYINLGTQVLIAAIFASSYNVIAGWGGLISFGHAAFFGAAGYGTALLVLKGGFGHFAAAALGVAFATVLAGIIGALALRATGISFLMITLALGQILWGLSYRWVSVTGGDNGLTGLKRPAVFGLSLDGAAAYYYFTLAIALLALLSIRSSPDRRSAQPARDSRDQPRRMARSASRLADPLSFVYAASGPAWPASLLLPPLHRAPLPVDRGVGGSAADGDPRRRRHAERPDRRRGDHRARPQPGERLRGALADAARRAVPARHHVRARGASAGGRRALPRPARVRPQGTGRSPAAAVSETLLRLKAVSKSFGGVRVVRDVDLAVAPGERRLILGPNGAGKTTLFNLITGDVACDRGSIVLNDTELAHLPTARRVRAGLARTYQIISLFPHDSLRQNVVLALLGLSRSRWNPFDVLAARQDLRGEADRILATVHRPYRDKLWRSARTGRSGD